MLYVLNYVTATPQPIFPKEEAEAQKWAETIESLRRSHPNLAWRYGEGPGSATAMLMNTLERSGYTPPKYIVGRLSSVSMKRSPASNVMNLRLSLQSREYPANASKEERNAAYDMLQLPLASTEAVTCIDALRDLNRGDMIAIMFDVSKSKAKNGNVYYNVATVIQKGVPEENDPNGSIASWVDVAAKSSFARDAYRGTFTDQRLNGLKGKQFIEVRRGILEEVLIPMVEELNVFKNSQAQSSNGQAPQQQPRPQTHSSPGRDQQAYQQPQQQPQQMAMPYAMPGPGQNAQPYQQPPAQAPQRQPMQTHQAWTPNTGQGQQYASSQMPPQNAPQQPQPVGQSYSQFEDIDDDIPF